MTKVRLQPGTSIDRFTIGEQVHKGGMAVLFDVTHPDQQLPMLMKVPILTDGEDPAAIVGFEMEQLIMPRLSGPHVPRFIAAGDFAVQPYIVFERIFGTTLFGRLSELPLDPIEVAALGAKIATAIHDLHHQHVIHLDIKPSNIMLREPGGEVVLIDFGLSHHDQLPDLLDEEFRVPYGSAPYMAPEQVYGIRDDPRSDQFALGALMYFFAKGQRPFGDPQSLRGLKRRVWEDPNPPRALNSKVPSWLQEIILRCLSPNPDGRYPTAAQLAYELSHPREVRQTLRAEKVSRDPWSVRFKRRYHSDAWRPQKAQQQLEQRLSSAPIVAAAIDLSESHRDLAEAIRVSVGRILSTLPEARLACLNVLRTNLLAPDTSVDEEGNNLHVQRLVMLKDWARGLGLPPDRITCHVLEAVDAGDAIMDYLNANPVDHVVLGATTGQNFRNVLGSVATQIVQNAPCSVTVVRKSRRETEFTNTG